MMTRRTWVLLFALALLASCAEKSESPRAGPKQVEQQPEKHPKVSVLEGYDADGMFKVDLRVAHPYVHEYSGGEVLEKLSRESGAEIILRYHGPCTSEGLKKDFVIHELIFRTKNANQSESKTKEPVEAKLDKAPLLKDVEGNQYQANPRIPDRDPRGRIDVLNIDANDPHFKGPGVMFLGQRQQPGGIIYTYLLPVAAKMPFTVVLPQGEISVLSDKQLLPILLEHFSKKDEKEAKK